MCRFKQYFVRKIEVSLQLLKTRFDIRTGNRISRKGAQFADFEIYEQNAKASTENKTGFWRKYNRFSDENKKKN